MSHCLVVDIERQVFFVVRGIQRPIRRGPATVAKSVRVPREEESVFIMQSIHTTSNTLMYQINVSVRYPYF